MGYHTLQQFPMFRTQDTQQSKDIDTAYFWRHVGHEHANSVPDAHVQMRTWPNNLITNKCMML